MKLPFHSSTRRRRVALAAGVAALTCMGAAGVALRPAPADELTGATALSGTDADGQRDAQGQEFSTDAGLRCSGPTCNPEQGEGGLPPRSTTTLPPAPPVARVGGWSLAPRAAGAFDSDDLDALTAYVASPNKLRLDACGSSRGSSAITSFQWSVNGTPASGCNPTVDLQGRSGTFNATVTVTDSAGRSSTASTSGNWKDNFVVTLGDSIASGEGNPDVPQQYNGWFGTVSAGPQWPNKRCHRTPRASSQQTVTAFEASHPNQSVTYVNLACSGATILNVVQKDFDGRDYAGIEPQGTTVNPPQLDVVAALKTRTQRTPDAVILSAGANDFGFGPIANDCAMLSHDGTNECSQLNPTVSMGVSRLHNNYPTLKRGLDAAQIPASKVVISQYPNPTHTDSGQLCDTILNDTPFGLGTIHKEDVMWADGVVNRLNGEVGSAASTQGWRLVPGIRSDFQNHGYCASDHWVNRYSESDHNQGNISGSLHPNAPGTGNYSTRITQALAEGGLLQ